ncbi:sprT-like domain-containing protein Spartan [Sinocyclocheilus rhinocerous]|uniref:sprT-like domain-containing protein Spartan n=1 Tax=Sinocyclocheilus rhinocerous TaxID=307959 RepID=UPI0007BAA88B|nr:PREDICTED: sprT-like domain-containing protein Spartan [Sinocyclocheilus rhinocerous]
MEDEDFLLALRLQEQFDQETATDEDYPSSKKRKIDSSDLMDVISSSQPSPERPLSIVDASWEMLDPNPDARAMFLQFNDKFFWGKLSGVEVKWSPRMTLCAGVCSYEGRGGLCSVRLSEPLLKLRPRKDLVQTLLHEMIHALLFVTQNNRDRDGHGPEFCNHMNRINQASGTNITIYHSFHDEVDVYRQHWWRCNGPCQNHRPFFGYVKRAMNRPPSARDPWWAEHQRTCGGTYTKIKEPENYGKTGKSDKKKDKNPSYESSKNSKPPSSTTGSGSQDIRNVIPFNGRGFVLGGTSTNKQSQSPPKAQPEPLTSPPDSPLLPRLQPSEANSFKRVSSGASNVPRRKSVSNTNAFVNVDGSPVRISKVNDLKGKQRSVRDLFQAIVLKSPERAVSAAGSSKPAADASTANPAKCKGPSSSSALEGQTSLISNHHSYSATVPKPESHLSKYFGSSAQTSKSQDSQSKTLGSPQKSATGTPGYFSKLFGSNQKLGSDASSSGFRNTGGPQSSHASVPSGSGSKHFEGSEKPESNFPSPRSIGSPRTSGTTPSGAKKRSWDDHKSEHIFDYFQQTNGKSSTSTVQQREEVDSGILLVRDEQANNPPILITVHCPVCHIKVPESTINEHLDSCLS